MSALTERCMLTTDTLVAVATSLNSMGPTPTRTLGMRLSCNFVNVYTIVHHAQYTYTCTRTHPQRTSSRGKARLRQKSADKSRRGSSCAVGLPRAPRQAAPLPREDPCAEVGEEVRVGVGVGVGPMEFRLYTAIKLCDYDVQHCSF